MKTTQIAKDDVSPDITLSLQCGAQKNVKYIKGGWESSFSFLQNIKLIFQWYNTCLGNIFPDTD